MRRTASRTWPASTARRSPSAAPSSRWRAGRPTSRPSRPRTSATPPALARRAPLGHRLPAQGRGGLSRAARTPRPELAAPACAHGPIERARHERSRSQSRDAATPPASSASSPRAASRPGWWRTTRCRSSALEFARASGGASQDPAGKPGVAYFLSGMLDEGAGPYQSEAFHERLDEFAIELRFGADRDTFSAHLRTLVRHRDRGLRDAAPRSRRAAARRGADGARARPDRGRHPPRDERPRRHGQPRLVRGGVPGPSLWPRRAGHAGEPAADRARRPRRLPQARHRPRHPEDRRRRRHRRQHAGGRARPHASAACRPGPSWPPCPTSRPAHVGERRVIDLAIPQSSIRFGAAGHRAQGSRLDGRA